MHRSPSQEYKLELTMLGTGDAFASRGRFQSGYMISGDGLGILLEAGPTSLCAMKRMQFNPADIDLVLISHLHGDHFAGLPFLMLEYLYESPRRKTLTIVGPRHLEERTWRLFTTMFPRSDTEQLAQKIKFVVIEPHDSIRLGKVRLSAIRTPHMKLDVSLAFRIAVNGKTVVFSGDSGWTDEMVDFAAGADLFLCECTYFESVYLDFHLNYPLLAANRDRFDVKRLLLTHVGREVIDRSGEVEIEMASDGMKIAV